jgi:CheY-like chemotaxis protein
MLMILLETAGYSVVGAADGMQGLDLLYGLPEPCLVLLDLMMPIMNGWEFLQAKRESDILATIPVVIVSAFTSQAPVEKVEGILKKPIDLGALLRLVKEYC